MAAEQSQARPAAGEGEHTHLQLGMSRDCYASNSSAQAQAVSLCAHLLERAAEAVPLPQPANRPLAVAEWGCSHGNNSRLPVEVLARTLQRRLAADGGSGSGSTQLQLQITHVDVAANDFAPVFEAAEAYTRAVEAECPGLRVFYAALGRSMYRRSAPDRSLDLGFSFSALHWQSKRAVTLRGTINAGCSKTLPEEHAVLRAHAMTDLTAFLTLRAAEFRPGGQLVFNLVSYDEDTPLSTIHHHDAAQAVAEELVAEGRLAEAELGLMAAPVYFLDRPSREAVLRAVGHLWDVAACDERALVITSPAWQQLQDGEITQAEHAKVFAGWWRGVMEPFIVAGLRQGGRSQAQVDALVAEFFARLEARALADPHPLSYPTVRVLLQRTATAAE